MMSFDEIFYLTAGVYFHFLYYTQRHLPLRPHGNKTCYTSTPRCRAP